MDPYEILDLPRDADRAAIRAAVRRKRSIYHPDRMGGNAQAMIVVNKAAAVLSDPQRRAQFDATGNVDAAPPVIEMAKNEIRAAIGSMLTQMPDHADMVEELRRRVRGAQAQVAEERQKIARETERLNRRRAKIVRKDGDDARNLFLQVIDHALVELAAKSAQMNHREEVNAAALTLLEDYEFKGDPPSVGGLNFASDTYYFTRSGD